MKETEESECEPEIEAKRQGWQWDDTEQRRLPVSSTAYLAGVMIYSGVQHDSTLQLDRFIASERGWSSHNDTLLRKSKKEQEAPRRRDASRTVRRYRPRNEDPKDKTRLLAKAPGVYEPRKKGAEGNRVERKVLHKDGHT